MTAPAPAAEPNVDNGAAPLLSIVIPSWNTLALTRACLASLAASAGELASEVIVVDNGSTDASAAMIEREFPAVRLLRNDRNLLYSRACNQGGEVARGRYLCLLNSDTVVPPGTLRPLLAFLEQNPGHSATAPRLDNMDGSLQPICRRFPRPIELVYDQFVLAWFPAAERYRRHAAMADFDHLHARDVEQPPGTCIVLRTADYRRLGGLDESMPLFYSDVDLCKRLWLSVGPIRFLPEARLFHVGSASVVRHPMWRTEFVRSQIRYFRKHHGWFIAMFGRFVVLVSALALSLRTLAGRSQGKRAILRQVWRSTLRALAP
jgi:N-acetylglucosaminyl-diphospho-decaprenol L-rhamnosyltransferase